MIRDDGLAATDSTLWAPLASFVQLAGSIESGCIRMHEDTPCATFCALPKKRPPREMGLSNQPSHGGDHDVQRLSASPVLSHRFGAGSHEFVAFASARASAIAS